MSHYVVVVAYSGTENLKGDDVVMAVEADRNSVTVVLSDAADTSRVAGKPVVIDGTSSCDRLPCYCPLGGSGVS